MESEFARNNIMARVSASGERFADPAGMGAHQIELKLSNLVAGNPDVGQFAHARGDGVGDAIFRHQRIHHGACAVDRLAGIGVKQDGAAFGRDLPDLLRE